MNLAGITHETLSRQLGKEIPEVYVVVAKHRAAGMDPESIADIIGCDAGDVEEVERDSIYKEVRQAIGVVAAMMRADQGPIWDSIEDTAARRLLERVETIRDTEELLRVAATANRMTRRNSPDNGVLDPARGIGKAAVTLTSRMVQRITQAGHREVMEEKTLSIHDGSMSNPSFDEVDKLLAVREALTPKAVPMQEGATLLDHLDKTHKEKFG